MERSRRSPIRSCLRAAMFAVIGLVAGACSAYEATRVVDLDDPGARAVRRSEADSAAADFVDSSPALVRMGRIETSVVVEPSLAAYVQSELEAALGVHVASVRVEAVGYRYAYYFPSRHDDFVLEVDVDAPAAGITGRFEGRIRGNEHPDWPGSLGADWDEVVPDTGEGLEQDEQERRLERRVDYIAWMQRVKLLEVVRRLVAQVSASDPR